MKQKFALLIILFCSVGFHVKAQTLNGFILPEDPIVQCSDSETFTFNAEDGGLIDERTINASGQLDLGDDQYSSVIDLGFTFEFFGIPYTQVVIGSNNYLTFNLASAGTGSGYTITNPIPDPAGKVNSIMCPWQDINPNEGGTVTWVSVGEAPNRVFIVSYEVVPMFSCTELSFTSQVHLYETCNTIETHILEKPLCETWNNGRAIHGLHNATGTLAVVVEGLDEFGDPQLRNSPTTWTTFDEGTRFTPVIENGISTYEYENIPFCFVPLDGVSTGETINLCAIIGWEINDVFVGYGNPKEFTFYEDSEVKASLYPSCPNEDFNFSTVFTYVTVPIPEIVEEVSICYGSSFTAVNGNIYNQTGLYNDTIISPEGCFDVYKTQLMVEPIPIVVKDTVLCLGDSYQIGNSIYSQTGTYIDTLVISSEGCLERNITNLLVTEPQITFPNPIEYICITDRVFFTAEPELNFYQDLLWNTGDTSDSLLITVPGFYELTATDQYGCQFTNSFVVEETCPLNLFVPNTFTPNNDGINDVFIPVFEGVKLIDYEVKLYDRWGTLVFESKDPSIGWDGTSNGKKLPSGYYAGNVVASYNLYGKLQMERSLINLYLLR